MEKLFHLNNNILHYDKIIIFGVGMAGHAMLLKLIQHDIKVECFADSDPEKCCKKHLNIPIIHINKLIDECERAAVIVSGRFAFTTAKELLKLGFQHIFYDFGNEVNVIHLEKEGSSLE